MLRQLCRGIAYAPARARHLSLPARSNVGLSSSPIQNTVSLPRLVWVRQSFNVNRSVAPFATNTSPSTKARGGSNGKSKAKPKVKAKVNGKANAKAKVKAKTRPKGKTKGKGKHISTNTTSSSSTNSTNSTNSTTTTTSNNNNKNKTNNNNNNNNNNNKQMKRSKSKTIVKLGPLSMDVALKPQQGLRRELFPDDIMSQDAIHEPILQDVNSMPIEELVKLIHQTFPRRKDGKLIWKHKASPHHALVHPIKRASVTRLQNILDSQEEQLRAPGNGNLSKSELKMMEKSRKLLRRVHEMRVREGLGWMPFVMHRMATNR